MSNPRTFPNWEDLYRDGDVEKLPWYWPALDPDLDAALARCSVKSGRFLDEGTGPGTQAIELARRGFVVTASDLSPAAIVYASRNAHEQGVQIEFVVDDVLASKLSGPYDAAFDRGCFHTLPPDRREDYAATMARLVSPGAWLFVKTFSDEQPGDQGPYRFTPDELSAVFASRFDVVDITRCIYQGQLDPNPKALLASMRRK